MCKLLDLMHCILLIGKYILIGTHTYYCNDKEQDCFSPLSYYSMTEHHVQLQKKIKHTEIIKHVQHSYHNRHAQGVQ